MYDVMATTAGQGGASARRASAPPGAASSSRSDYWAPDRHRTIPGEEAAELVPALAPRDPKEAYLFYDCQTDDARLVLTMLGEAERFGAVLLNGAEVVELISDDGRARAGVVCVDGRVAASASRSGPTTWSTRPASGPTGSGPRRSSTRRRSRGSPRAAAPTSRSRSRSSPLGRGGLHRPRRRGADDLRPALVRAGADRDHRQRLRRRHRPRPARRRRHRVPARRGQLVLRPRARPRRPHRRLRRRAAADLDRRPAQVGGHLAQGGAVRDLLGAADDHRRQADHLAADGEAGRRPDGRARGPRGALPHRRDPARACRRARRTSTRRRACAGATCPSGYRELLAFRYGHAARNVLQLAGERPELARPIVAGQPDLLAEAVIAARLEQARSVADVLLRRTRLGLLAAPQLRDAEAVAAGRRGDGRRAGLERAPGPRRGRGLGRRAAASEGIDPGNPVSSAT